MACRMRPQASDAAAAAAMGITKQQAVSLISKPPSRSALAIAAGFLAGLILGHVHYRHNQVVMVEHLYANGPDGLEPVRTSFGFSMVVHDFAALPAPGSSHSRGFVTTATTASSQEARAADAGDPGTSSSGSSSGYGGRDASSSSSSSSSDSSSSSGRSSKSSGDSSGGGGSSKPRFLKGGPGGSFLYSESSTTGLTAADKRRIAKVLEKRAAELPGDSIHALMTGNGSPYQNIQGRIMYASMKLIQAAPGGDKIKAFTRIMHRTTDDDLTGEFPTFRAYPLQPSCDTWCEFPVKDRANAVVQWLMAVERQPELVQGAWLLLLESDYVWMEPLQLPGSAHDAGVAGLGFTYDYIDPQFPSAAKVMAEMCPDCNIDAIPRSGPSPVLIRPADLALVAPDWEVFTAWIEGNQHASDVLGWVREMYAWCAAVHKNGIKLLHEAPPKSRLISQPPHDFKRGAAAMLHYTWGALYNRDGKEFWRFDKRDWTAKEHELKVPQFKLPPQPWEPGWKLQDGLAINKDLHELMTAMLTQMNKASAGLPVLESNM